MAARKKIDRHDAVILRMANEGAILKEICDAVGETSHFVYARLNRVGAPPLMTRGERLERQIAAFAAAGLTLTEISARVGRDYSHVCSVAGAAGIEIVNARSDEPPRFDHDLAMAWYRDGMTGGQIAKHFGVSRQRISQLAARAGLKRAVGRPRKAHKRPAITLAGGGV